MEQTPRVYYIIISLAVSLQLFLTLIEKIKFGVLFAYSMVPTLIIFFHPSNLTSLLKISLKRGYVKILKF